jgi:1,4-alpha-glucan branching enzyme
MAGTCRSVTETDLQLINEGIHVRLADALGAHLTEHGAHFAVWAPRAVSVSVIGSFNGWSGSSDPLVPVGGGIWQGFVSGARRGARYKYQIESGQGTTIYKADPVGFFHEQSPGNASVLWDLNYHWADDSWMSRRRDFNSLDAPIAIYEVHLGSWRNSDKGTRCLTYPELAATLIPYVKEMGFTHVEFLPVMEHPFYGSWGYQTTGYFAPTSRYGTPQEFMRLIDDFHQNDIGVILDWVPSHFPQDAYGFGNFDGEHEYESADPRRGLHPEWNSFIFSYDRGPVRSFLLSSALFWLERYHADGLRVDAVTSMLYLDYARKPGEWLPNVYGGRENLDAIGFLRRLNEDIYRLHPNVQIIAEESTAWPKVSRPTYLGGLGFGLKWDMGWMHDTLQYMSHDPLFRKHHHSKLTFRSVYAFNENFILPLSHDEVVYGKRSLLSKMPGNNWQKFASLRLLFAYMYAQPGKKLLFMGDEIAQWKEWNHDRALDWQLLTLPPHAAIRLLVGDLNRLYRSEAALHSFDHEQKGFKWIEAQDAEQNILAFQRNAGGVRSLVAIFNFSPIPRANYRLGVPRKGFWKELLNTDSVSYGGSGRGNFGGVSSVPVPAHGRAHSVTIELPPLAALYLTLE